MSPRTYQRRIRELRDTLLSVEWVQPSYNGSPSCPFCLNQQHWGHEDDCPVVTLLGQPVKGPCYEGRPAPR
jgi:hypothetical protein